MSETALYTVVMGRLLSCAGYIDDRQSPRIRVR